MNELTVTDVLEIIRKRAQDCRENGDSDMRIILYTVNWLKEQIAEGKSKEVILSAWYEDEE